MLPVSSAHKLYVKRLYKRSLKLAQDWYWQRSEFREKAMMIRMQFEANKNLTNMQEIEIHLGFKIYNLSSNRKDSRTLSQ